MTSRRSACGFVSVLCLASIFFTSGASASQQETPAPLDAAPQTPVPAPPQPTSDAGQNQNNVAAPSAGEAKTQPPAEPAKKQPGPKAPNSNARHRVKGKRVSTAELPATPRKIVVRQGGVDEPLARIVTGMTPDEAARKRNEAELLLSTTAETLKEIAPRPLAARQEETVSQIHNYMEGARAALREGDIPRAHTLAQKASLLADDLLKH